MCFNRWICSNSNVGPFVLIPAYRPTFKFVCIHVWIDDISLESHFLCRKSVDLLKKFIHPRKKRLPIGIFRLKLNSAHVCLIYLRSYLDSFY